MDIVPGLRKENDKFRHMGRVISKKSGDGDIQPE